MKKYDYLVVGAGLFGSIFAYEANKRGKKVLVIDKRNHVGGNIYCENIEDINVHKYGAHIFHTSNKEVWDYVNSFVEFNRYTNSPVANYKGELYSLPFNMNTFYQLWKVKTPKEAIEKPVKPFKRMVDQCDLFGNYIKTWESISFAARTLKISSSNISACCKGKLKTSGGYIWKYAD